MIIDRVSRRIKRNRSAKINCEALIRTYQIYMYEDHPKSRVLISNESRDTQNKWNGDFTRQARYSKLRVLERTYH